ncbi:GNAT family N-acetyltransferase [Nocardiopsis sp. LOL_012]|uniref:GNAT family N-acetyltransferase n=1 Tax=Nocardiopsis sp. LOL_012 TaxID=3345409 RepID=UPI003A89D619
MSVEIRGYEERDRDAVVDLSLRAWEPVHASLRRVLGAGLYDRMTPDWRAAQREAVTADLDAEEARVWVALADGAVAGFVSVRLRPGDDMGEITLAAVDPAHQGRGIGTELTVFAVERIRDLGMGTAMVETGGDEGHAPARRAYEKAGLVPLPITRYFTEL